jgi:putative NADH-flavin reductase
MPDRTLRIAVIGASGHLGGAVAREALSRGHQVTAIARDAARLRDVSGATPVSADVLDPAAIAGAVRGHDAVVASVTGRHDGRPEMVAEAARTLLAVLPGAGAPRLVFVGGGGSLEVAPGQRFVDLPEFPPQYRAEALAQVDALAVLRRSDGRVRWSYASPPPVHLVDGERTGRFRVRAGDQPIADERGESRISVADYAAAIVDELERGAFVGRRFTAAY